MTQQEPSDDGAIVALRLMQVLRWENPQGTIASASLPPWLVFECVKAVQKIGTERLKAELAKHPDKYPGGLIGHYLK
jgi:hypothetical protein